MNKDEIRRLLEGYSEALWYTALSEEELQLAADGEREEAEKRLVEAKEAERKAKAAAEAVILHARNQRQVFVLRFRYLHPVRERNRTGPDTFRLRSWDEVVMACRYSRSRVKQINADAIRDICRAMAAKRPAGGE